MRAPASAPGLSRAAGEAPCATDPVEPKEGVHTTRKRHLAMARSLIRLLLDVDRGVHTDYLAAEIRQRAWEFLAVTRNPIVNAKTASRERRRVRQFLDRK